MANPENDFYPSEGRVEFVDFDVYPDLIADEYYGKGTLENPVAEFLDRNIEVTSLIAISGAAEPKQEE